MYLFEVGLGAIGVVALLVSIVSYWLLVRSFSPAWAERARDRWTRSPTTCVLTGIPVAGAFVAIVLVLGHIPFPVLKPLAVLFGALSFGVALAGAGGLAARAGEGLASRADEGRAWMRTLKGGVALLASCLVPILGWFVIAPLVLIGGAGAALFATFGRDGVLAVTVSNGDVSAP